MKKNPIYIHCSNHFDPIWRRGFKKAFFYRGEKYVGNSAIQEACIEDWLSMSANGDELKFEVECSLVLRTYLEKHPEKLETFKRLLAEGRFELLAAGEIIPDPHMPLGETLVRNLIYGLWWAEETLGVLPTIGCVNDGFGSSAQMPQLFRGCGIRWLTGLSYGYPTKDYWRGLDGSTLYIQQNFRTRNMKYLGRSCYYRPCPHCRGEGCEACLHRGFDHSYRMGMEDEVDALRLDMERHPFGLIEVGGEESLVVLGLESKVAAANAVASEYEYRFMLIKDLAGLYEDDIAAVDSPDPARVSVEIEGKPVSSGCLVSRIRTKQETRRLENRAESIEKWAALAHLLGQIYPLAELREGWRGIAFSAFHDSITGTHVDVGYDELLELYGKIDSLLDAAAEKLRQATIDPDDLFLSVFNPLSYEATQPVEAFIPHDAPFELMDEQGEPTPIYETKEVDGGRIVRFRASRIPGLSWKSYRIERRTGSEQETAAVPNDSAGSGATIENEFYRVTTNDRGITSIYDKRHGQELVDSAKGYANELILEHDVGDPWTTRELHRPRLRLGNGSRLTSVERSEHCSVLTYRGRFAGNENVTDPLDYRVMILEWEQKVILHAGVPRVDFETKIDWDCFDRRIRISFPTPVVLRDDPGHYAIPYGTLTRKRYEMGYAGWENANGDWPAVEWGSTGASNGINVAILNRGTPSYRIERGEILVSVLRSPTFPNCLLWPREYNAPVYDGMRDQGEHTFCYSLYSYEGDWQDSEVVREAYAYNKPMLAFLGKAKDELPRIELQAEHTLISAMKKAERGEGVMVRLFEHGGREDAVVLTMPPCVRVVWETDLLEREKRQLPLAEDRTLELKLSPFEIKTLKLEVAP